MAVEIDQKRAYRIHHIPDRGLNRTYLIIASYDQVDVIILDSTMSKVGLKTYGLGMSEEKHYLTEPLGFTAENGLIHGFYSNHDLSILGYLEFNLRSRRGVRRGQLPIDFNRKDEFLFHYIENGTFYVASATKKTSVLKVYRVFNPKTIRRSLFRVDVYRDLHEMFKLFSEPKSMDVGVVVEGVGLNVTSKKIKAYPRGEELRITFETVAGTEIIDLDLENETYTDDLVNYRKFQKVGKANNSNSYIHKDMHFVARSSGEEIFVYAEKPGERTSLVSERFTREDKAILFASELESGGKIWTSSSFYRNTPKDLIRDIDDGNIAIRAEEIDTAYVITVGNFKESTNPLTDPYGSKISGRNDGESSYFKVLVNKDFEVLQGRIEDQYESKLDSLFSENDMKARYVYSFKSGISDYVFFQDKKEKSFYLYRMD